MKRLLGLVCCFVTLTVFAQVNPLVSGAEKSDSIPPALSPPSAKNLILLTYCNEALTNQSGSYLSYRYKPQPRLQFQFNLTELPVYNPATSSYYFYPMYHPGNSNVQFSTSGSFYYGSVKRDMYNPYGVTRPSEAIFVGTLNYLLNKRRR
jgi:hypothetical protein